LITLLLRISRFWCKNLAALTSAILFLKTRRGLLFFTTSTISALPTTFNNLPDGLFLYTTDFPCLVSFSFAGEESLFHLNRPENYYHVFVIMYLFRNNLAVVNDLRFEKIVRMYKKVNISRSLSHIKV